MNTGIVRLLMRLFMRLFTWLLMLIACAPARVMAQGDAVASEPVRIPRDASDSSQLARLAYRSAGERLRAGDTAATVRLLDSASRQWPSQPAYAEALLEIAGRFHDAAMVRRALERGAAIGVGFRGAALPAWEGVPGREAVQALIDRHVAMTRDMPRSKRLHSLPDSAFFPEGIAFDAKTRMLYVSSIHRRTIASVAPDGHVERLLNDSSIGAVFALAVDPARRLLWASTHSHPAMEGWNAASPTNAMLIAVDLRSGLISQRIPFPSSEGDAQPGDLAVLPNGDVLVSDGMLPVLWRLRRGAAEVTPMRHRLFRSLQAIVPSRDGRVAWVADYAHGLLRVVLDSATVTRVRDLPGETTVGMDGMVRHGNTFVAIQNGIMPARVVELALNANGTQLVRLTVLDRNPLATSPTTCIVDGASLVYVANSLWELLDRQQQLPRDAALPRPLLLRLPLPEP